MTQKPNAKEGAKTVEDMEKKGRKIPLIITEMNKMKKLQIEPVMRRNVKSGRTTMLVMEAQKNEVLPKLTKTNTKAHSYPTSGERTFMKMLMNVDKSYATEVTYEDILEQITVLPKDNTALQLARQ